jgi:hypothetical protein
MDRFRVQVLPTMMWFALLGCSSAAQDADEPFGRIRSGLTVGERQEGQQLPSVRRTRTEEPPKPVLSFFASPSLADVKGAFVSGVSIGLSRTGSHPLQLKTSYKQISIDNSDDSRDKVGLGAKFRLKDTSWASFTLAGDYANTQGRAERFDGVLIADVPLGANGPFALSLNVGAARNSPKESDGMSDLVAGAGLSFSKELSTSDGVPTNIVELGADYSIENDLDGEDDYSFSVGYSIRQHRSTLLFGAGKHGAVFIAALVRF